MKKINEIILEFIEENLKSPQKIVFMGSGEAGHYGNNTLYQGTFFLGKELEYYTKKGILLPERNRDGSVVKIEFNDLNSAFEWRLKNEVDSEEYQNRILTKYNLILSENSLLLQDREDSSLTLCKISPMLLSVFITNKLLLFMKAYY